MADSVEIDKKVTWHEYQIHVQHRCLLRIVARHLNSLQSPSKPPITEATLLQEMLDDIVDPPPDHVLPDEE